MTPYKFSLTKQEAFDRMWKGLEGQGWEQSLSLNNTVCTYHGNNGKKCPVGYIIDGNTAHLWGHLTLREVIDNSIIEDEFDIFELLVTCQLAHDNNPYPNNMKSAFIHIAEEYGLKVPGSKVFIVRFWKPWWENYGQALFSTRAKAEEFLTKKGLTLNGDYWLSSEIKGTIEEAEVDTGESF